MTILNIYLLTQDEVDGYDTYDSVVVIAANEEDARNTLPDTYADWLKPLSYISSWATSPENVKATLIGQALPDASPGVVLASFNAG
jgi:hypothetical protein